MKNNVCPLCQSFSSTQKNSHSHLADFDRLQSLQSVYLTSLLPSSVTDRFLCVDVDTWRSRCAETEVESEAGVRLVLQALLSWSGLIWWCYLADTHIVLWTKETGSDVKQTRVFSGPWRDFILTKSACRKCHVFHEPRSLLLKFFWSTCLSSFMVFLPFSIFWNE